MRNSYWSSDVCSSDLEHQRQNAGKEEDEVEHQLHLRLGTRLPQAINEVAAHMAAARQRVGAAHHEERAVHDEGDVKRPGGRRVEQVADDDLVGHGEGHDQDQPGEGLAEPRRSEEHTSELQSLMRISYAVFCLKKKK